MRIVRFLHAGQVGVGVRFPDGVVRSPYNDVLALIADGAAGLARVRDLSEQSRANGEAIEPDRYLAPIPSPGKILSAEDNYPSVLEDPEDSDLPEFPRFFAKLPSAVIGPEEAIMIPRPGLKVDYEVELACVIGSRARQVHSDDALDYVWGYTIINDVSERDIQLIHGHTTLGKGMDTFCPMGPEIVLTDEIDDPSGLHVSSYVNAERRQDAPTSELRFGVPELIERMSEMITLEAGDVISTGTPGGVGVMLDPPQYLEPGDEVTVEVDRIGRLTNPVQAGW